MNQPILECKNICFSYHNLNGETRALTDISFQVDRGEFVAIVGPSGCGNAMVLFWILWIPLPVYFLQKAGALQKTDENIPVLFWHRAFQVDMGDFSIPHDFFNDLFQKRPLLYQEKSIKNPGEVSQLFRYFFDVIKYLRFLVFILLHRFDSL